MAETENYAYNGDDPNEYTADGQENYQLQEQTYDPNNGTQQSYASAPMGSTGSAGKLNISKKSFKFEIRFS